MAYDIRFSDKAFEDIQSLRAFERSRVTTAIEQFLTVNPKQVSKSRIKQLAHPFWCEYRLRVDSHRVYYNVFDDANAVEIVRIIEKGRGTTPEENP